MFKSLKRPPLADPQTDRDEDQGQQAKDDEEGIGTALCNRGDLL